MNTTNLMYKMFKEMKEGYRTNQLNLVEHGARCWLDCNPENPFTPETPEYEAFFQMQKCYIIWKRGDVNRKNNQRKMLQWALALCKLNPRQPYKFDKKAEEEDQAERARMEQAAEQALIEKEAELKAKQDAEKFAKVQKEIERRQFIESEKEVVKTRELAISKAAENINKKPDIQKPEIQEEQPKEYVFGVIPEKVPWYKRLFKKKANDEESCSC